MKNINFLKENLIAHRGLHSSNTVENTLKAFIRAIEKKYIIEIDIHILKDDTIVVYHDFSLKRLTGVNKMIENLSYPQLSKIKIKNKYQIPTLEQVMNIVKNQVPLLIEIKTLFNNVHFYKKLSLLLDNYQGMFAIHSFNPYVIEWFYKNKKQYLIGLIIYNDFNYQLLRKYHKMVDFLSIYKKQLPFRTKKMVIGWTIKNKNELKKYQKLADNLIVENII
jgi:glycerophosphoryl diester phosphodiesterase